MLAGGPGFGVGTFDCLGKGALVVVSSDLLGQTLAVQAAAGVATVAGHNWSLYLRFTGGRGLATAIGVLFGVWMWEVLLTLVIVVGVIGYLIARDTGLWTFLSMLALPPLAMLFGEPAEYVYMAVAISVTLALKRLTANWERPGGDYGLGQVLAFRLLWDRDVRRREAWTSRRPVAEDNAQARDV